MEVRELGHIVLCVRDLERSARFYGEVLGWRRLIPGGYRNLRSTAAAFAAPYGRTHHELVLKEVGHDAAVLPGEHRVGMYQFGLRIGDSDDDLREAVARLAETGIPLLGATDHGVTHSLYVKDPDGNGIELYVDVPGVDWRNDPDQLFVPARRLVL